MKFNTRILACLTASCLFMTQQATANPYAGQYEIIDPPAPTSTSDKIEVVELFWYTCPHCFSFEKEHLEAWREKKPADVEFIQMQAVFEIGGRGTALAKVYYVAKALKIFKKVHIPLFQAIHEQRNYKLTREKPLQKFFAKHAKVSEEDFTDTYHSFGVDTEIAKANEKTKKYGINSVPSVIVNGKYRLNSRITKGYGNMMKVIDYLIEKERKLLPSSAKK